ncbi:hypothetical protein B0H14DRAFT_2389214, partial [Mycena olivaceomarginata]
PPSLYFSTTAGVTLNRKHPGHPDAGHPHKIQLQNQEGGSGNGLRLWSNNKPPTAHGSNTFGIYTEMRHRSSFTFV